MTAAKDASTQGSSLDVLFERLAEVGPTPGLRPPAPKRRLPLVGDASWSSAPPPNGDGLRLDADSDEPVLLGLPPAAMARQALQLPDGDALEPPLRSVLRAARDALLARAADAEAEATVIPLDHLPGPERARLWDMLGEGEVSIVVVGASRYEIDETSLPGLYRVRTRRGPGAAESLHLEVGAIPAVVAHAAEHATLAALPIEEPPPPGLMNAQPLLAEIRHRMGTFEKGAPNHVISLSLLPLNEADGALLARSLGAGPITAESRGYGTCRVSATARRGVWSVQYWNAMDALILDTLEIGGVPSALLAAPTDLLDSGMRLAELLGEAPEEAGVS